MSSRKKYLQPDEILLRNNYSLKILKELKIASKLKVKNFFSTRLIKDNKIKNTKIEKILFICQWASAEVCPLVSHQRKLIFCDSIARLISSLDEFKWIIRPHPVSFSREKH